MIQTARNFTEEMSDQGDKEQKQQFMDHDSDSLGQIVDDIESSQNYKLKLEQANLQIQSLQSQLLQEDKSE